MGNNVKQIVRELLAAQGSVASRDVGARTGLTRQGIYPYLSEMVEAGELRQVGAGRGTRYEPGPAFVAPASRPAPPPPTATPAVALRRKTDGLDESAVWQEVTRAAPFVDALSPDAESILHYALTELVNNVVDHAEASEVEVLVSEEPDAIVLEVLDWGVGIFDRVMLGLHLSNRLAALQELSKGRTTTDPDRHTGEGIFFTSKAVDLFQIDSGGIAWRVDNRIGDTAVGDSDVEDGTRVRVRVSRVPNKSLRDVFDEYTSDFEFNKTRIVVRLFELGADFVSRSEAKRLLHGLERFREVVLDFAGVRMVGQGFCDEVFRVWARQHPGTRVVPVSMIEPVSFMVRRAQPGA